MSEILSELQPIEPKDVPRNVEERMLKYAQLNVPISMHPTEIAELGGFSTVEHQLGVSYLARYSKRMQGTARKEETEWLEDQVYLVDANHIGQLQGLGKVLYRPDSRLDYFRGKPFVGWTETILDESTEQGLAICRLRIMNIACNSFWGVALNSSRVFNHVGAEKSWKRLVELKEAEKYTEQDVQSSQKPTRYRFKA